MDYAKLARALSHAICYIMWHQIAEDAYAGGVSDGRYI